MMAGRGGGEGRGRRGGGREGGGQQTKGHSSGRCNEKHKNYEPKT